MAVEAERDIDDPELAEDGEAAPKKRGISRRLLVIGAAGLTDGLAGHPR